MSTWLSFDIAFCSSEGCRKENKCWRKQGLKAKGAPRVYTSSDFKKEANINDCFRHYHEYGYIKRKLKGVTPL